ncbi:hypothetical protein M2447_000696 [Ereboglobus sp. PH5-10]|uniref:hypothetical protein n=1 Tax=Ereboglobus sp. PH5-10 TaxID=2940629 RepID=UPI0024074660|nr:hypothetical protein [Ereboglobus sp. PH5-10]MDF9826615.1 hypothetical protein [Ereboglobus sp. PH5-10]
MSNKSPTLNGPCSCGGRYLLTPGRAQCEVCKDGYQFVEFPAFRAERVVTKPHELAGGDDATCFFHAQNQAEGVCSSCGRFLCPVCAVDFGGRVLCPACIAGGKTSPARVERDKWMADTTALWLAVLPLIAWPLTIATAPAAFALVLLNWNKPASIVRRFRWQRWVAGALSLAQIAGWVWLFVEMFSK